MGGTGRDACNRRATGFVLFRTAMPSLSNKKFCHILAATPHKSPAVNKSTLATFWASTDDAHDNGWHVSGGKLKFLPNTCGRGRISSKWRTSNNIRFWTNAWINLGAPG